MTRRGGEQARESLIDLLLLLPLGPPVPRHIRNLGMPAARAPRTSASVDTASTRDRAVDNFRFAPATAGKVATRAPSACPDGRSAAFTDNLQHDRITQRMHDPAVLRTCSRRCWTRPSSANRSKDRAQMSADVESQQPLAGAPEPVGVRAGRPPTP